MHWKLKAAAQNAIAMLPESLSYAVYYRLQRLAGRLRRIDHLGAMSPAIKTWSLIKQAGGSPSNKTFLEVGTGRTPLVPMAYWLMGAKETITLDVNPYMRGELFCEAVRDISCRRAEVGELFGESLDWNRYEALLAMSLRESVQPADVLALCHIKYMAPCDASRTALSDGAIDFHTSNNVLEHIPPALLVRILQEGGRLLAEGGLFIHRVDYSDHFAQSDPRISAINFLRFSDAAWSMYADNRYMYMNRLRHDDMCALFLHAGHRIVLTEPLVHEGLLRMVLAGFPLDGRFKDKAPEVVATTSSWFVSRKADQL
jgi:SAM-dependent methyltransferase